MTGGCFKSNGRSVGWKNAIFLGRSCCRISYTTYCKKEKVLSSLDHLFLLDLIRQFLKKLLLIAPYFLPRRRVGSLRPFKFAIHLQNFGWEPHIITIASDGQLTRKEQKLLKDISVYQLDPPFDYTSGSGSQLQKKDERSQNNNFGLNDWIDKQFPVDTWLPFFMLKYQRIRKIVRTVNPDAIWSTGDPWSAHWVGRAMACLDPGRFWIADFRDPWTLSQTDLKKRSSFSAGIDRKMERRLINSASMVSFTTDSTRRLYENHYKDLDLNTTTIYNAFDRLLFDGSGPESIDLAM